MSEPLLSGARDAVHLFAADLPEDDFWGFLAPDPASGDWPLRQALGGATLDPAHVEGAVVEDLEGIGLAGFLAEGIGVDEALLAADADRIAALSGPVVILRGAAFDGARVPITPRPPLRYLASYALTAAPVSFEPLPGVVPGETLPPPAAAPAPAGRNRWILSLMAGIAALILLTLVFGVLW